MALTVLKLGGSVLTRTVAGHPGVRLQRLRRLASEAAQHGPVVLVHGSGAFGKPPAHAHGYSGGHLPRSAHAVVSDVGRALETLHRAVLAAVRDSGRPAVSFHATHLCRWAGGALRLEDVAGLPLMLDRGLTPVIASGFVADADGGGFAVASSDVIALLIARALNGRLLAFATEADGVYRHFPDMSDWYPSLRCDDADALAHIAPACGDVTGGMAEKLRCGFEAARAGIRTLVVDGRLPGNVDSALRGHPFRGTELLAPSSVIPPTAYTS